MSELLRGIAAVYFVGMCGSGLWFGLNISEASRSNAPGLDEASRRPMFWLTLALMIALWPLTWTYCWVCLRGRS